MILDVESAIKFTFLFYLGLMFAVRFIVSQANCWETSVKYTIDFDHILNEFLREREEDIHLALRITSNEQTVRTYYLLNHHIRDTLVNHISFVI